MPQYINPIRICKLLPAAALAGVLWLGGGAAAADQANAERGSEISGVCAECHGHDGNSTADNFPTVAAQGERYLFEQMVKIRAGKRSAPLMAGMLDSMTDQDLRDIAAWYAGNEATVGQATGDDLTVSRSLYLFGDAARQIPACSACHGPAGKGLPLAGLPALTGQRRGIVVKALKNYRSGDRTSAVNGAMYDISRQLTDREIDLLADFIQGLY